MVRMTGSTEWDSDAGMQHALQAQQACLVDAKATGSASSVGHVGMIGLGTMGVGITTALLAAGLQVTGIETSDAASETARSGVKGNLRRMAERGKLTDDFALLAGNNLTVGTDRAALASCDLVIEAAFEDFGLKKQIAAWLTPLLKPGAVIASNTSTLDIDAIAMASGRPENFVGMHFFSPAQVMPLLEIIRGKTTSSTTLAAANLLALRIGKVPVVSGVCYGFIGNRMAEVYMRETEFLLLEGVTPARIDDVMQSSRWLGMAMGPCRMLDMAGIDVGARTVIEHIKSGGLPPDPAYRIVCQEQFRLGRFGQKTGAGYYMYHDKHPIDDPYTEELCERLAHQHGIAKRKHVEDIEIYERLIFPMINEAAKILDEGIASRAGDIDVVWTLGYGFPKNKGGPLYLADRIGLKSIVQQLDGYANARGNRFGYWDVSPLLRRIADGEGSFANLNQTQTLRGTR